MRLRRVVGCAVVVLLLASVALPAMCGACVDLAAKAACGEKHGVGASGNKQDSIAMDGDCTDCSDQTGITATETGRHAPVSEFVFFDCARGICVRAEEQNATIYRGGVEAHRLVSGRISFGVSDEIASTAMQSVHLNVLGSNKIASGNSTHQPPAISLKI